MLTTASPRPAQTTPTALAYPNNPDLYRGRPSLLNGIALENDTTVTWTPPRFSAGNGLNVPKVLAGETGTVMLTRCELMQNRAPRD